MTEVIRHPLVRMDLRGVALHVARETHGDLAAGLRRVDESQALIHAIAAAPDLGRPLDGALFGWRVRHGGRRRMLTIVYRADPARDLVFVSLVAFGGQDWHALAAARRDGFA